ncbi:MAG: TonB-dependent siderophore receptor [Oceanospirillaceae bacterium]|nr:TonB-dependent siderophore receptor [Oceanospirillaceae bacterium]
MMSTQPKQLQQAVRKSIFLGTLSTTLAFTVAISAQATETLVVTASALKVDTPMAETPKSVSVISQTTLENRSVQKLDEAMRYTAGVLSAPYGADNDADWFKVRGFDAATYLNGNRVFKDGYYSWMIEPVGLASVEVVKGPASILFGAAPPGGAVNAVQKTPTKTPQGNIAVEVGSRNHTQISLDQSGWLDENGDKRYRVVSVLRDQDGELEGTDNQRLYLAPSLSIDISAQTKITFLGSFLKDSGVPTNPFFPAYGTLISAVEGKIDPSTNFGEPGYDAYERTQASIGYQLEHQLDATWTLSQNFNYGYNDQLLHSTYAFPNSTSTTLSRGHVYREGNSYSTTLDNKAIAKWDSDNTEHTLLLGVDLQQHINDGKEIDSYGFNAIDALNPVYGNHTPVDTDTATKREISKQQISAYAQYQSTFDQQWVAVLGARFDFVNTKNNNLSSNVKEQRKDRQTSLNLGLMYLAENGLAPYINYSESFEVLSTVDSTTSKLYKPLEGRQTEIGIKYTPEDFDGYFNVAWFDIKQKNALVTDPTTWVKTQTGEVTSQGIEAEVVAQLNDHLQVGANYTYTDVRTDETSGQGTQQAGLVPRHSAATWFEYDMKATAQQGFSFGSGLRYTGASVDNPGSSDLEVPGHLVVDAHAKYQFNKQWQAQLNVSNLTDKEYVSSCDYYCYLGESRKVVAQIKYNW